MKYLKLCNFLFVLHYVTNLFFKIKSNFMVVRLKLPTVPDSVLAGVSTIGQDITGECFFLGQEQFFQFYINLNHSFMMEQRWRIDGEEICPGCKLVSQSKTMRVR